MIDRLIRPKRATLLAINPPEKAPGRDEDATHNPVNLAFTGVDGRSAAVIQERYRPCHYFEPHLELVDE
ncbi:hypothetical protein ACWCQZ_47965 [Streptomyces sp. NPDC002285]